MHAYLLPNGPGFGLGLVEFAEFQAEPCASETEANGKGELRGAFWVIFWLTVGPK